MDDIVSFDDKIRVNARIGSRSKYPNIELNRDFNPKVFRDSNRQITRLASTRAGTIRNTIQTFEPRKHRMGIQGYRNDNENLRSSTRKDQYMKEEGLDDDDLKESESQYW